MSAVSGEIMKYSDCAPKVRSGVAIRDAEGLHQRITQRSVNIGLIFQFVYLSCNKIIRWIVLPQKM